MPRRVGRLLLRSSLLEALAYPHGVDRYVELVRPLLVKRQVRAAGFLKPSRRHDPGIFSGKITLLRLGQPETDSLKITVEQFHIELLKEFR